MGTRPSIARVLRRTRKVFLNALVCVARLAAAALLPKLRAKENQREVKRAFGLLPFVRLLCTSVVAIAA
jgi:hypothetical protein